MEKHVRFRHKDPNTPLWDDEIKRRQAIIAAATAIAKTNLDKNDERNHQDDEGEASVRRANVKAERTERTEAETSAATITALLGTDVLVNVAEEVRVAEEEERGGPLASKSKVVKPAAVYKTCACGREYTHSYIYKHQKNCAAWQETQGKHFVDCQCGATVAKSHMASHRRACKLAGGSKNESLKASFAAASSTTPDEVKADGSAPALPRSQTHPIPCPLCLQDFKTSRDLRGHVTKFHPEQNPHHEVLEALTKQFGKSFECAQCHKVFKDKQVLRHHIQNIHMGIRHECKLVSLFWRDISSASDGVGRLFTYSTAKARDLGI